MYKKPLYFSIYKKLHFEVATNTLCQIVFKNDGFIIRARQRLGYLAIGSTLSYTTIVRVPEIVTEEVLLSLRWSHTSIIDEVLFSKIFRYNYLDSDWVDVWMMSLKQTVFQKDQQVHANQMKIHFESKCRRVWTNVYIESRISSKIMQYYVTICWNEYPAVIPLHMLHIPPTLNIWSGC